MEGYFRHFGLEDWWLSAFSDEERDLVGATFRPLGLSGNALTEGHVDITSVTAVGLHFLYQQQIQMYYKDREDPEYLEKATKARYTK